MLKIALCDDSENTIYTLSKYIDNFCQHQNHDYSIVACSDGVELTNKNEFFNVIFLDIDMPNMNGIQTAKEIRKWDKNVLIIYVTSYPEFKNYAFAVHAFGYIQKPIDKKQVYYYLNEAISYRENKLNQKLLTLKTNEGILKSDANTIHYFEYSNRKTLIITEKGNFTSSYTIGYIYSKLKNFGFEMPHKSFVVNMLHIKSIYGFNIEMVNGDIVPLAQKKAVFFKKKLNDCLQDTFELI